MEQHSILSRRGVRARLARELGLNPSAPYQWDRVPADRLIEAARILNVHPRELRADLYPDFPSPAASASAENGPASIEQTAGGATSFQASSK